MRIYSCRNLTVWSEENAGRLWKLLSFGFALLFVFVFVLFLFVHRLVFYGLWAGRSRGGWGWGGWGEVEEVCDANWWSQCSHLHHPENINTKVNISSTSMLTSNSIFWKIFSIFWQIFLSFLQIFSIFSQIFSIFWQIISIYWQIYSIFWPFFSLNILTNFFNPLTNLFNILTNLDKIRSIAERPQEFWYTFQSFKQLRETPRKLDSLVKCWGTINKGKTGRRFEMWLRVMPSF